MLFALSFSWFWSLVPAACNLVVLGLSVLLILLVLIQRGKGGGLSGAFGGAGGSSAFGSKAGDTFTRITIGVAAVWIVSLMVQIWIISADTSGGEPSGGTFGTEQTSK